VVVFEAPDGVELASVEAAGVAVAEGISTEADALLLELFVYTELFATVADPASSFLVVVLVVVVVIVSLVILLGCGLLPVDALSAGGYVVSIEVFFG
jgi:hypothetical protein